jgi:hypothetical protein
MTLLAKHLALLPSQECVPWSGYCDPEGYARCQHNGRPGTLVHRLIYEQQVGPIPDGFTIDHVCHNDDDACPGGDRCLHRRCINVQHLEAVSMRTNVLRGKTSAAQNARKTHCPQGHAYTESNTYVDARDRRRHCRTCGRASVARRYEARQEDRVK